MKYARIASFTVSMPFLDVAVRGIAAAVHTLPLSYVHSVH
jgi:hypothetical protein